MRRFAVADKKSDASLYRRVEIDVKKRRHKENAERALCAIFYIKIASFAKKLTNNVDVYNARCFYWQTTRIVIT